ncbi:hypothetical protein [Paracoccus sp. Ld10]|uniref:hypothetical protein n=1 Tax=Paracoccus sp. Ld10 TaxID=649158 RepID=UPI00386C21F2
MTVWTTCAISLVRPVFDGATLPRALEQPPMETFQKRRPTGSPTVPNSANGIERRQMAISWSRI